MVDGWLLVFAALGTSDLERAMAPEDYAYLSTHAPSMLKALPLKAQALASAAARGAQGPVAAGGALGGSRPGRGASASSTVTSASLSHLGAVAHRLSRHALANASSFDLDFASSGIDLHDPSEWRAKMGIDFSMAGLGGPHAADAAFVGEHVRVPAALGASLAGAGAEGSLNWVHRGVVPSDIPDQGLCSSCWAFTGAASVAAGVALAHLAAGLPFVASSRSAQQFVSCDEPTRFGCRGGTPAQAFSYARLNAIELQSSYPYVSWAGAQPPPPCSLRPDAANAASAPFAPTLLGYRTLAKGDEASLLDALRLGPVAVGVDASSFEFLHYSSGVLDFACGRALNHAMLVVGYGYDTRVEKPYWVLRNSWGSAWGEGGYVRLVRDKNMCGVADLAAYPVWNAAMLGTPWEQFVRLWHRHLLECVGVSLVLAALGFVCFAGTRTRAQTSESSSKDSASGVKR